MDKASTLTKKDSLALKGIAILLMIFHHCFLDPGRFAGYTVSFAPFSQDFTVSLSYFSKIYVGIFAFISGYGLYLSFSKQPNTAKSASAWTVSRTIKTMSGYWFIYILALISTWIYADLPIKTYCTDGNIRGAFYAFLDFLGLASLFKTPTLNTTWWYMGAAILFIALVPCFTRLAKKIGYVPLVILIVMLPRLLKVGYPGSINPYGFLLALLFGMLFAQYNLFTRMAQFQPLQNKTLWAVVRFLFWLCALVICYLVCSRVERYQAWELHYAVAPLIFILFCKRYVVRIPVIQQLLCFFGKHSLNIFLIHTFIRFNFFTDFIYSFRYFWLITLVLFGISLGISIVLEWIKKGIRFDIFTHWLCTKTEKAVNQISNK